MSAMLAPVALFAYARPDHLRRTLDALRANAEARATPLFVFCDGAKRPEQAASVDAVRSIVASIEGFASVTPVLRAHNLGLAASITGGVSAVLSTHGRVIVVEDDILVAPNFLRYMNDALDCYAEEPRVAAIHGYCFPTERALPETFFLRGADCWGWATWSRAWAHFSYDGAALLRALHEHGIEREFDLDGAHPYMRMLKAQVAGSNDSWAIRWHASCFIGGLLTLYPGRSLAHNIGHDGSGTHCGADRAFDQTLASDPVRVVRRPIEVDDEARRAMIEFLSRRQGSARRLFAWLQRRGQLFLRGG
jgi:hypothetical protein